MRLIIDIPEEVYKRIQSLSNADYFEHDICGNSMRRIANGTPLPKGHGRLIDADAELQGLRKMKVVDEKDKQSVRFAILEYENAPTIIEADKAEREE